MTILDVVMTVAMVLIVGGAAVVVWRNHRADKRMRDVTGQKCPRCSADHSHISVKPAVWEFQRYCDVCDAEWFPGKEDDISYRWNHDDREFNCCGICKWNAENRPDNANPRSDEPLYEWDLTVACVHDSPWRQTKPTGICANFELHKSRQPRPEFFKKQYRTEENTCQPK